MNNFLPSTMIFGKESRFEYAGYESRLSLIEVWRENIGVSDSKQKKGKSKWYLSKNVTS